MNIINLFIKYKSYYLTGIKTTLVLSLLSLIIGSSLGIFISIARMSDKKIVKFISKIYIEIIRGTPMLVQISIVYFGSYVLTGIDLSGFLASLIAVSLNSSAYVAEIIRSGVQSIDIGQIEASQSLGLSKNQTLKHIIFPQAVKNILPALGNEFVTLIKETSVASTIGVSDLMYASKIVQSSSFQPFSPLVVVAIIYFILTFSLSKIISYFERRLEYND